ncbi:MAG: hypothetical protein JNL12_04115 [Planctomycetes bacterium]|nr:hypothetical protein [Planctomycetota bacterium]
MELHLPLVVATPTLLCLLAAVAALLWPRRSVLWPFLLPAWWLDLCFLGLWQCRAELAGPVLVWFRIDLPGLVWTALAGPIVAVVLWRRRATPAVAALRERPWRLALLHAVVVAFGLVPLPLVLCAAPLLGVGPFRRRFLPLLLPAVLVAAVVAWPFPGVADAVGVLGVGVFVAACAPHTVGRRPAIAAALAWAAVASWRAIALA